jgi:hypothetical protein
VAVIDDDGIRVYGVFYIPQDEADLPVIVRSVQENPKRA